MIKIPEKLYVVSKKDEYDTPPLGFLHAYEPTKASFKNKKLTQDKWAYLPYPHMTVGFRIEETPTGWVSIIDRNFWVDNRAREVRTEVVPILHPPQIWDNTPLHGFKVLRSVARWTTSNKLWRIEDPRGIQFEISTECFEDILMMTNVEKGVIVGKCQWQENKKLLLVE